MKIQLDLTQRQLDVLLSTIETTLLNEANQDDLPGETWPPERGPKVIEVAGRTHPNEDSYDIEMLCPVYAQLAQRWTGRKRRHLMQDAEMQLAYGERLLANLAIERALEEATRRADR